MKNWIKFTLLVLITISFICCTKQEIIQPAADNQIMTNVEVRIAFEKAFQQKN